MSVGFIVNFLENFCKYESAQHMKPKEIYCKKKKNYIIFKNTINFNLIKIPYMSPYYTPKKSKYISNFEVGCNKMSELNIKEYKDIYIIA